MSKHGLAGCAAIFDIVTELANASSALTFGHVVRGDGHTAKADIQRLLSHDARVCRNTAAAVSYVKARPGRLKFLQFKTYGYETRVRLDSSAVPTLTLERICNRLNLEGDRPPAGLTMADGQRARSIVVAQNVSASFNHLHLAMDFYVMKFLLLTL